MYYLELAGEASDEALGIAEAERAAASAVTQVAPGLATADDIRYDRIQTLAYTHHISTLIGQTDATQQSAVALLRATFFDTEYGNHETKTDIDSTEMASTNNQSPQTVAVRARNVRSTADISTASIERALGDVLVTHGYEIDLENPTYELRACFADDTCLLGWAIDRQETTFGSRTPTNRPFFQPGSMAPRDARAYVNLAAGPTLPEATVFDPMVGTGGILIEAGLIGATVIGSDVQSKMAVGATQNLAEYLSTQPWHIFEADATELPVLNNSIDAVIFDAPYGRQSKIAADRLSELIAGALTETIRIAPRCVIIADRSYTDIATKVGWTVTTQFKRRVHRSLTRYVHILRRVNDDTASEHDIEGSNHHSLSSCND